MCRPLRQIGLSRRRAPSSMRANRRHVEGDRSRRLAGAAAAGQDPGQAGHVRISMPRPLGPKATRVTPRAASASTRLVLGRPDRVGSIRRTTRTSRARGFAWVTARLSGQTNELRPAPSASILVGEVEGAGARPLWRFRTQGISLADVDKMKSALEGPPTSPCENPSSTRMPRTASTPTIRPSYRGRGSRRTAGQPPARPGSRRTVSPERRALARRGKTAPRRVQARSPTRVVTNRDPWCRDPREHDPARRAGRRSNATRASVQSAGEIRFVSCSLVDEAARAAAWRRRPCRNRPPRRAADETPRPAPRKNPGFSSRRSGRGTPPLVFRAANVRQNAQDHQLRARPGRDRFRGRADRRQKKRWHQRAGLRAKVAKQRQRASSLAGMIAAKALGDVGWVGAGLPRGRCGDHAWAASRDKGTGRRSNLLQKNVARKEAVRRTFRSAARRARVVRGFRAPGRPVMGRCLDLLGPPAGASGVILGIAGTAGSASGPLRERWQRSLADHPQSPGGGAA